MSPPLLTVAEAAKHVRMSEGWIKKAIRDGELQVIRFGKVRGVRIRIEDLQDYIERKIEVSAKSHELISKTLEEAALTLNQRVNSHDR